MNSGVEIKLFEIQKTDDYKTKLIKPNLPRPCFRWNFIGASNSGKTTLIKNILFNKDFGYINYFDEIYSWVGSLDDFQEFNSLVKYYKLDDKITILNKFEEDKVMDLVHSLEKDNARRTHKIRTLFVFDDMICQNLCNRSKMGILDEIFIRGRHIGINIIISSQKYKSLNNNIRLLNATHTTIFSNTQSLDLEEISKEHNGVRTRDEMMEIFRTYLNRPYQFITIDSKYNSIKDSKFLDL